jgi:hypothetical protein
MAYWYTKNVNIYAYLNSSEKKILLYFKAIRDIIIDIFVYFGLCIVWSFFVTLWVCIFYRFGFCTKKYGNPGIM